MDQPMLEQIRKAQHEMFAPVPREPVVKALTRKAQAMANKLQPERPVGERHKSKRHE